MRMNEKRVGKLKMKRVSGKILWDLLDHRENTCSYRGILWLSDKGFYLFEQQVQGVPFLDRSFNVVHQSPISFHLGFQFCLQSCCVFFQVANLVTDWFLLLLYHRLEILLVLYLILGSLVVVWYKSLGWDQMWTHVLDNFVLFIKNLKSPMVGLINFEKLSSKLHWVSVNPLEKYDIVLELSLAHFFKRYWLVYFEFFQSALEEPEISQAVIRVLGW